MSGWPDPHSFITPAPARAIRRDLDSEREANEALLPAGAKQGSGDAHDAHRPDGRVTSGTPTVKAGGVPTGAPPAARPAVFMCGPREPSPGDRATVEAFLDELSRRTSPVPRQRPAERERPCGVCGAGPARPYMNAWLCVLCAPLIPVPDPERTLDALQAKRAALLPAMKEVSDAR